MAVLCAAKHHYPAVGGDSEDAWLLVSIFRHWHPAAAVPAGIVFALSTLVTNLIANIISPANDLANLSPKKISFKAAAVASVLIACVMQPWKLADSPHNFISGKD